MKKKFLLFPVTFVTLLIILISCQSNGSKNDTDEYRAEQQRLEQEREEEEARERFEKKQNELLDDLAGVWSAGLIHVNTVSGYASFEMKFTQSKRYYVEITEQFTGRLLDSDSGTFEIIPASENEKGNKVADIIISSNRNGRGWIEMRGRSFSQILYFADYSLRKIED